MKTSFQIGKILASPLITHYLLTNTTGIRPGFCHKSSSFWFSRPNNSADELFIIPTYNNSSFRMCTSS